MDACTWYSSNIARTNKAGTSALCNLSTPEHHFSNIHERLRAHKQHATADRLLALAVAAIAEGCMGQERVRAHEQHAAADRS
jgi:hypothetical protein